MKKSFLSKGFSVSRNMICVSIQKRFHSYDQTFAFLRHKVCVSSIKRFRFYVETPLIFAILSTVSFNKTASNTLIISKQTFRRLLICKTYVSFSSSLSMRLTLAGLMQYSYLHWLHTCRQVPDFMRSNFCLGSSLPHFWHLIVSGSVPRLINLT